MLYQILECHSDGLGRVDIPEGAIPVTMHKGIGIWLVLALKPLDRQPCPISAPVEPETFTEAPSEDSQAPLYVSKKDRTRVARS